ncbi:hypothetical protein PYCCODRAFT_1429225, partial [Trametes coccinea BRFM310]
MVTETCQIRCCSRHSNGLVVQHPIPILSNPPSAAEQSWMSLRDPGFATLHSDWAHLQISGGPRKCLAVVTPLANYTTDGVKVQHDITMVVNALVQKTAHMQQILGSCRGRLADCSDAGKLPKADRMLLQVWVQLMTSASPAGLLMGSNTVYFVEAQGGNLIIDGHYYRVPAQPTDAPLWPLDTFHLMLRSYVHGDGAPESLVTRYCFLGGAWVRWNCLVVV